MAVFFFLNKNNNLRPSHCEVRSGSMGKAGRRDRRGHKIIGPSRFHSRLTPVDKGIKKRKKEILAAGLYDDYVFD
jgi:hypothetical protein